MQVHCYQFNRSIFVDMTGATVYEPVPLAKWVATQPVTTDTTSLSTNRAGETPLASLSPSEMTLVLCYGPYLDVYNGRRLSLKLKLEGSISSVSWSLDGRFILVVLESSLLSLYEVAVDSAGKVVELKACYQATAKENVKAVTFLASENVGDSTDEYFFASLSDKSTLSLWTVNESRLKLSGSFSLDRLVNAASGLLWDSSKSQLVIVGSHPGGSRMSVWRFSKNAPHFTSPTQEVLPPIESGAASLTWNSIVSKIQQVFQRPVLTKTDALASWDLSWNSKYFLAVTSIGQVEIWDCEQPTMVYEASSLTLLSRFLTDKDSEDSLVIRAQFTTKDAHSMLLTFDTGHLALLNFTSEFSLKKVDYASQFYPHVNTAPVLNDRIYVAEKESGLHRAVYRDGSEKLEVAKTRLEESSRSVDLISAVKELALKYLAFSTSALLWQWDQQPQVPETLKAPSDIQECIYQLTCILPLPPREYLERKMHHKEFKDALTIAQKYSLPCDDILEAQFREALESRHLQVDLSVLDQIQDKGRVRDICLNLHNSPEIARQLLTYALHLTDSLTPDKIDEEVEAMLEDSMRRSSTDPGLSVTDRCILRLQCLRSLDRLETYEAIQPNCYEDPRFRESFRAFCQEDLTNVAVGFASEGNTSALHILFTRHGSVTLPYRKHIMSFLPDGLEVSAYKLLLPQNGNGNSESHQWIVAPWRQADWIEDSKYTEFIGLISEEESPSNRLIQEPDSIDWSEWYKRRVTLVEGRSGLVDSALDLANDGISRGIQGLEQMQRKLVALKNMIYSDMSSKLEDFSISTLESLPADDLLRTMILLAEPSLLTKHISNIIVPFLSLLPNPLKTLKGVLAKLSESDLEFITAMVKSPVVAELLEFSSDTDIKHMILDCVYAYQFVDAPTGWQLFVEFLERPIEKAQTSDGWDIEMNEFDELDSPARAVATNALKTRISVFKKHLTAKEILSQYHLNRPFSWFVMSAEAPELQNELFKEILECITRARSPTDSDSSLEKLVKYLLTLHESGILSRMPRKKLLWDTISVILRSGRKTLRIFSD